MESAKKKSPAALRQSKRGIALIVVLSMLALMTVLVLSMFTLADTERRSSAGFAEVQQGKGLADIAVNLVIGQLRAATSSRDSSGGMLAWASQPGAVRTWNQGGQFAAGYKLYSSSAMVVKGGDEAAFGMDVPPASWDDASMSLRYTDLNAPIVRPVKNASGTIVQTPYYPVMDPRAAYVDTATGLPQVEGFSADAAFKGVVKPSSAIDANARLPMPVEWLYLLRDGTVGTLDSSNNFVTTSGTGSATEANPITGRVAFWTDDESCKLNLNASAEGTPWDSPRCVNLDDMKYGLFQPANREYQRYPGHPFMNGLSPVLLGGPSPAPAADPTSNWKESIYKIIPRVKEGGTIGATRSYIVNVGANGISTATITNDSDRLYVNPDEFLFRMPLTGETNRELNQMPPAASPASPAVKFTQDKITLLRSFITTNSRSAEVNLFGLPRVSIWPVDANPVVETAVNGKPRIGTYQRTAFDHLSSFCATLATKEYYFQRWNAISSTDDWNNIQRNQRLMQYLRSLCNTKVPGYGESFNGKWTAPESDQVMTEIIDYIRSANLRDPSRLNSSGGFNLWSEGNVLPLQIPLSAIASEPRGFGRFTTLKEAGIHIVCTADGSKVPTNFPGITGGVDPAIPYVQDTNAGNKFKIGSRSGTRLNSNQIQVQCSFITEMFSPSQGFVITPARGSGDANNTEPTLVVTGLNNLRLNGTSLNFGTEPYTYGTQTSENGWHINWERGWGGGRGLRPMMIGGAYVISFPVTLTVTNPATPMILEMASGQIMVKVCQRNDTSKVLQTIRLNFPRAVFPIPQLVAKGTAGYLTANTTTPDWWWSFNNRYNGGAVQSYPYAPGPEEFTRNTHWWQNEGSAAGFKAGSIIRSEDVVRTVGVPHGDYRMTMGQVDVAANVFKPNYFHNDPNRHLDHIISEGVGPVAIYGFSNEPKVEMKDPLNPYFVDPLAFIDHTQQLLPITDNSVFTNGLHYSLLPEVPIGAGKYNKWGDFDNGISVIRDGAYINKPDEGNLTAQEFVNGQQYPYYAWASSSIENTSVKYVLFSPARLMPSPGMFGSLPTGVYRNSRNPDQFAWQTLLFRPESAGSGHPGLLSPPDHTLMDWFWMPVCEPYALSEPLTSIGKINLNTRMLPFSHINRNTALYGLMRSESPLAIDSKMGNAYKIWNHNVGSNRNPDNIDNSVKDPVLYQNWNNLINGVVPFRKAVDVAQVVDQMLTKFQSGLIYKSGTEVSTLHLVRKGETLAKYTAAGSYNRSKFWEEHMLTGDNSRERPYTNLYARLSTKSNSYTVHYRVQSIRMPRTGDANKLDLNNPPVILSDQRGSVALERFLDANERLVDASGIALDYADKPNQMPDLSKPPIDAYYRYRVLGSRRFEP